MFKQLFVLALIFAFVFTQTTVTFDNFEVGSDELEMNQEGQVLSNSVQNANILGGERDQIIEGLNQLVSSCDTVTKVDPQVQRWVVDTGSGCSAESTLQYDGVDGSPDNAFGLGNINLFSLGSGVTISVRSDFDALFTLVVYSGQSLNSEVSELSITIAGTGTNTAFQQVEFTLGQLVGDADLRSVTAIEIILTPTAGVRDTQIDFIQFASVEVSGRVFNDCDCDGSFDQNEDSARVGVTVSVVPDNSNACANAVTLSGTTDQSGDYVVQGLVEGCTYTLSVNGQVCFPSAQTHTVTANTNQGGFNFGFEVAGSLQVPPSVTVGCNDCTQPTAQCTGVATVGSGCGGNGSGDVTSTDDVIASSTCENSFTIRRTWCVNGVDCAVQTITVQDNGNPPSVGTVGDVEVPCGGSVDPNSTGRPVVSDDCTANPDLNFSDLSSPDACDQETCTRGETITRTWTANDRCGGVASTTQFIRVQGCAGVVPTCTPYYVQDDEECYYPQDDCPQVPNDDDDFSVAQDDDDDEEEDDDSSSTTIALSFATIIIMIVAIMF